jgi:NADH-quinone oxidoreductase subunit M
VLPGRNAPNPLVHADCRPAFLPLAAAVLLHFTKGATTRALALGASLLEFGLAAYAAFAYKAYGTEFFNLNYAWISSAGLSFHIGLDG